MKVTDLINLGTKALEMFDQHVAENKIDPPMRVYIHHFPTTFEISEKSSSCNSSSEIIQKPDWSLIVFDFIEKVIVPLPEFSKVNQSIAKKYRVNINTMVGAGNEISQSAFWLERFIQQLIYEKLEGTITEDTIIEYASLFKSELELSSVDYHYIHQLDGIYLETDRIEINDEVLLRKVEKSDLEYTRNIFYDTPRSPHMGLPSLIMEVNLPGKDETENHEYINGVFNVLRLYKLGSIFSKESISTKNSIIWLGGTRRGWGHRNYSTFKKYTIYEHEIDLFINFFNRLGEGLNFDKDDKKFRSIYVSLDRYNSALLESAEIDRKLMTAVMGLESLFTFEKDRGENAFKLGIRIAKLFSHLNFNPDMIRRDIEKAYSYRNKVVHGSHVSDSTRKEMNNLFPVILDCLRISLIIFILKSQKISKDNLIEKIDRATISDVDNEELKKTIKDELGTFEELIPREFER